MYSGEGLRRSWRALRDTGISSGTKAEPKGLLHPDFLRAYLPKRDKGAVCPVSTKGFSSPRAASSSSLEGGEEE